MAIAETDLIWRLSGGAANEDPAAALGGAMSTAAGGIVIKTETLNSLFDDISGAEAAAGDVEYRCLYIHNEHATLTWTGAKVWITTNTASAKSNIKIGLDLAGKDGTADTIATESAAPSPAVTFTDEAISYATGLDLGDMAAGEGYAIWFERTITAGMTATDLDKVTLGAQGDTGA